MVYKVYLGPVLSCGYFGTVERITGGTKHIGSNLYQKNNILAYKSFPLKNILVSAWGPFVPMNFRNILKKGI